jgi:hypothetical protein
MVRRADLSTAIANDIARRDFTGSGNNVATQETAPDNELHPVAKPRRKKKTELIRVS